MDLGLIDGAALPPAEGLAVAPISAEMLAIMASQQAPVFLNRLAGAGAGDSTMELSSILADGGVDEVDLSALVQDLAVPRGDSGLDWSHQRLDLRAFQTAHDLEPSLVNVIPSFGVTNLLIAGSSMQGPVEEEQGEHIYVTAQRIISPWLSFWAGRATLGGDGPVAGGPDLGGNAGGPAFLPPLAKLTPCVDAAPSGVPIRILNTIAKDSATNIQQLEDELYEYGVIFYTLNGQLNRTPIFSQHSPNSIDWNIGLRMIPDNAIIVAMLHNHPDIPGINDGIPSYTNIMEGTDGKDWIAYDSFQDTNTRGITADPNMLMYIYTNEDGQVRVYDKTDKNTRSKECSL